MTDNNISRQFNILCLSGGGFRGLYTVKVLAELEEYIKKPIAQCFDLIAGTSVGGIIAVAVALEIPISDLMKKFKQHGEYIFPSKYRFIRDKNIFKVKHGQEPLRKLVDEIFSGKRIRDLEHRTMIPSVNYSTGKPRIFKTLHNEAFRVDDNVNLSDVALATSAAPWYFPIHKIETDGFYVDGGLYGNAPDLLALHEAQYFLSVPIDNIHLLSIGTMPPKVTQDPNKNTQMSFWNWRKDLFSLMVSSQEQITDFRLQHLLKDRYHRIDSIPSATHEKHLKLDIATKKAIEILESAGSSSSKYFLGKTKLVDMFLKYQAESANFHKN